MDSLIEGLPAKEMAAMSLGLAHSLSRYKLKFSPDKVDTMIVQAIALLDDLDKELNNYMMRCREWYGWHFPELSKIITDGVAYVKTVKLMRQRSNCSSTDFSAILPEELEAEVKNAAEISMGTEVSQEDVNNITYLCDQVIEINEYRTQLFDYLRNRMLAIAPNLTVLVGELVGARLIAHAGSLINLAKHPSSTVQILGAEKALFRALKTKHDTPKYGLIYHASLITGSNPKLKGKVSRMLAAKAALAVRVDALGEDGDAELGIEHRAKVEARLRILDEGVNRKMAGTGRTQKKWEKYENKSEVKVYNASADSTIPRMKRMISEVDESSEKTPKKIKIEPDIAKEDSEEAMETETPKSKKKKKKDKIKEEEPEFKTPKSEKKEKDGADTTIESETPTSGKKKKKKKKAEAEGEDTADTTIESETPKSGKKKKKKVEQDSD